MSAHISPEQNPKNGTFTGRHMLIIMLAFFGVIIVVNMIMATSAVRSWSGLVVKNSYVASQEFNEKSINGKAQAALGWATRLTYQQGVVEYQLRDKGGQIIKTGNATAVFRRPVNEKEDQTLVLAPSPTGSLRGEVTLKDGNWVVEINTEAGLTEPYRHVQRIVVTKGVIQ